MRQRASLVTLAVALVVAGWLAALTVGVPAARAGPAEDFRDGLEAHQRGDYAEAVKWYRLAAEQGVAAAQFNLGVLYDDGRGVPQDYAEAYFWSNLAAAAGHETAAELRNLAAERIPPTQLAAMQRRARNWRPDFSAWGEPAGEPPLDVSGLVPLDPGSEIDHGAVERVERVQTALVALGYDPGPVDGVLGPRTRAAVRAWQAENGFPATGEVTEDLAARLEAAVAERRRQTRQAEPERPDLSHLGEPVGPDPATRPERLEKFATATGFAVSDLHVLTNHHVIDDCLAIKVRVADGALDARLVDADLGSDLALLQHLTDRAQGKVVVATFREGRGIRPGDGIMVVGFPLGELLASEPIVTTGTVSALAGPGDDRRLMQVTAPVQPGNSGGPLLDSSGNVVGVIVGKLDALRIASITGDIPQNVNFALSAGTARSFLDANDVPYRMAPSDQTLSPADIAAEARRYTVAIECWR